MKRVIYRCSDFDGYIDPTRYVEDIVWRCAWCRTPSTWIRFPVAGLSIVVTTIAGAWAFPSTMLGWFGLFGAGVGTAVGMLAFFAAFEQIGPVRATMLSNVEPLLGIVIAAAVLGEQLGALQWVGVVVVVAALVLFEASGSHRAEP